MNRRFTPRQVPILESIEPRILYSADLSPLIGNSLDQTAEVRTLEAPGVANSTAQPTETRSAASEIIFIDTRVEEWEKLLEGIDASTSNHGAEIILLDAATDGIDQITRLLEQRRDVTAIHIISHGDNGVLSLGSNQLDSNTLASRSDEFRRWGEALTGEADILIYGCNVASGAAGEQFVSTLAALTGADIAASDDLTGNASLGGDWNLEFATGRIETSLAIAAPIQAEWQHQLVITTNGTTTSTQTTSALSLTWSHTVNSGTDRMLIVEVAIDGLGASVNSVDYGGVALTQVGRGTGNHAVEIWALANPTIGTANVVVNFAGSTAAAAGATTYNGVDQVIANWKSSFVSATGTGTTSSVTVSSHTGDLVVDTQYWQGNPTGGVAGPGQTIAWWQSSGTMVGGSSTEAGAASVVMSGSFGTSTQWEIAAVSIKAAPNALPVNTVPGQQSISEDTTLNISGLSVNDPNGNLSTTSLTVGNGTLTVSLAGGASISSGANGSGSLALSGSETQINAALQTLGYLGNSNFNGSDTLTIVSTDSDGASDTDAVTITVNPINDVPVITFVSGSASYSENSGAVILATAATVTDVDSPNFNGGILDVSITANGQAEDRLAINHQGTGAGQIGVSGSNVSYQGVIIGTWTGGTDGSTPLVISFNGNATIAAVQALARNITYQNVSDAPSTAVRTLSGYVTDGDGGTSNIVTGTLSITPVNDAPSLNTSTPLPSIAEDDSSNSGFLVSLLANLATDPDSGAVNGIAIIGADTSNGSWQYSLDGSTWNAVGTVSNNQSLLLKGDADNRLHFVPNADYNGTSGLLSFRAWDQTSGSDGSYVDTSSNGGTTAFSFGSSGTSLTVTPVNDAPTITSNVGGATANIAVAENGTAVTTVTASDIDSATLTYSISGADAAHFAIDPNTGVLVFSANPNFESAVDFNGDGVYEVSVAVSDGSLTDTQALSVTVTNVNETPTAINLSNATLPENTDTSAGTVVGNLSASDPDAGDSATYAIVGGADAAFFSVNASQQLVITNGVLDFETKASYSVTVRVTDAGGLTHDQSFTVSVSNVNEAPVVTSIDLGSINEDGSRTIVQADLLAGASDPEGGALVASNLTVTSGSGTLTDHGDGTWTFTPTADWNGGGTFSFVVSDGALTTANTAALAVSAVNDAPAIHLPANQSTAVNTALTLGSGTGRAISISDVDSASGSLLVTLSASHGTLTLTSLTGLSFSVGDGATDSTMSFTGSLAAINAALDGLQYSPVAGYSGADSLVISVNDQGNSGSGGAQTDSKSLSIQVGATSFQQGSNGYTGVVDTYVDSSAATTAHGNATTVVIDSGASTLSGLLRFDNLFGGAVGQIPLGATIQSVTLSIYVTSRDALDNVALHRMLVTWDEASTHNSLSNGIQTDGTEALASADLTFSAGTLGWNNLSSASMLNTVQSWANGSANHGWTFISLAADGWAFSSSEGTASQSPILTINYTPPQAPVISTSPGAATYVENATPVAVDPGLTLSDADSTTLTGATVSIGTGYVNGQDSLNFTNQNGITGSWDAGSGTLTLSGSASLANYQTALRSVAYANSSQAPDTTARSIGFTVSDSYVSSATASRSVNVTAVNDAPSGSDRSVTLLEDGSYTVQSADFGFSDVDGNSFAGIWVMSLPAGDLRLNGSAVSASDFITAADIASGLLTYAPLANANGVAATSFSFQVEDNGGTANGGSNRDASSNTLSIDITPVNDAPTVSPVALGNLAEDGSRLITQAELLAGSADVDGNPLTAINLALTTGNGTLTNIGDSTWTFAPDANWHGAVAFSFEVSDGTTTTANSATLTVTPANDAPSFTSPAGTAATQETLYSYAITTSDADSGTTLTITAPTLPSWLTLTATGNGTATLSGTPGNAEVGSHVVSLQVSDGTLTTTQNFTIAVANINDAPTITSNSGGATAAFSVSENQNAVTTVSATDQDTGATLTYSLIPSADQGRFSIDANSGALTFNFSPNFESTVDANLDGVYEVIVQVSDGSLTDTQAISVTVTNVNETPTSLNLSNSSIPENTDTSAGHIVGNLSSSDPDALDSATYSIVGGADAAVFSVNASQQLVLTAGLLNFEAKASYDVTLRVTDGSGLSHDQALTISVLDLNEAPSFTSTANTAGTQGVAYSYTITTTDPDTGDSLAITAPTLPGWLNLVDNGNGTATLSGTPTNAQVGSQSVVLQVSDGTLSASQSFTLVVANVNDAPTVSPIILGNILEDGSRLISQADLLAGANDLDGDMMTAVNLALTAGTGNLTDHGNGTWTFAPTANWNGNVSFSFDVSDGATSTANTAALTVTPVNDPPIYTSTPNTAGTQDVAYIYTITTTDPDTGASLAITAPSLPVWLSLTDNGNGTATLSGTPSNAQVGSHSVVLQVSDGLLSASQSFTLSVANNNDAPLITSDGGGASASLSVPENQTAVTTVVASDVDAGATLTYSLTDGADAGLFSIDPNSGVLNFNFGQNFELTADANTDGVYEVTVQVSDGSLTDTQALSITVTNVNEAPSAVSLSNGILPENTDTSAGTVVGNLGASDPDTGDSATFAIVGGADAVRFSINASNQLVITAGLLDFETQASYGVTVRVTDAGGLFHDQSFTVSVSDVNETPAFTSTPVTAATQDAAYSYTITTTDPDTGASLFISATTLPGWLTLTDNGNGTATLSGTPTNAQVGPHSVVLQVSDGSLSATQSFTLTVANVNDAPIVSPINLGNIAEDGSLTITQADLLAGASDPDGNTLTASTLSLTAGNGSLTDHGNGTWTFTPTADWNGSVAFSFAVSDGSATTANTATCTVTPVNDAPTITSNVGGATANISVAENGTAVTTVTASDVDSATLTYSISGGADASRFVIDPNTGALVFNFSPNFESAGDANGDGVYELVVDVSDGSLSDTQALSVTVTNVNETPTAINLSNATLPENTDTSAGTVVGNLSASDPDAGDLATYAIVGGADAGVFSVNASQQLVITNGVLDFETKASYSVTVRVTDAGGLTHDQSFTVSVSDVNEAPAFSSAPATAATQDLAYSYTITTTDPDTGASLAISATTLPAWLTLTDHSDGTATLSGTPTNAQVGPHSVVLQVSDGSLTAAQSFTLTVANVNDAPSFSSAPVTAATQDAAYSYTITTTDPDTGASLAISATTLPAWLTLTDNGDGTATLSGTPTNAEVGPHSIVLQVSDGSLSATQSFTLTVANVNDAPSFTSAPLTAATEDLTYSYTITTTDPDTGASLFISATTLPGWLTLTDNGNGTATLSGTPSNAQVGPHNVVLQVSDGSLSATQSFTLTVANVNDAPTITSNGSGATASVSVAENSTAVTTVTASDVDSATLTYSISGADASRFAIDPNTGALVFSASPNFESAVDFNGDGVYELVVDVSDGSLSDTQALSVTVTNVNETPTAIALSNATLPENTDTSAGTVVGNLSASDPDASDSATYAIIGGADAAFFSVNASQQLVITNGVLDFETKASYSVTVRVTDAGGLTHDQSFTVSVSNVNEAPVVASIDLGSINEDGSRTIVQADLLAGASDPDGNALTATSLTVTSGSGTLTDHGDGTWTFTPAADWNGSVAFSFNVSDGVLSTANTASLTVTPVNDTPRAADTTLTATVDQALQGQLPGATDADGDTVTYALVTGPAHGSVTVDASGNFAYQAISAYVGSDSFSYSISDGQGGSNSYQVTLNVQPPALWSAPLTPSNPTPPDDSGTPSALPETKPTAPSNPAASEAAPAKSRPPSITTAWATPTAGTTIRVIEDTPGSTPGNPVALAAAEPRTALGMRLAGVNDPFDSWAPDAASLEFLWKPIIRIIGSSGRSSDGSMAFEPGMPGSEQSDAGWQAELTPARVAGVSFSVGVVWWSLRAGGLLASLTASLPAWRGIDVTMIVDDRKMARPFSTPANNEDGQ